MAVAAFAVPYALPTNSCGSARKRASTEDVPTWSNIYIWPVRPGRNIRDLIIIISRVRAMPASVNNGINATIKPVGRVTILILGGRRRDADHRGCGPREVKQQYSRALLLPIHIVLYVCMYVYIYVRPDGFGPLRRIRIKTRIKLFHGVKTYLSGGPSPAAYAYVRRV